MNDTIVSLEEVILPSPVFTHCGSPSGDYFLCCINHKLYRLKRSPGKHQLELFKDLGPWAKDVDSRGRDLNRPKTLGWDGICMHGNDMLVLTRNTSSIIRSITMNGEVDMFAGTGVEGKVDGPALTATFSGPSSVVYSSLARTLYVCDAGNNCIRSIRNGIVSTLIGGPAEGDSDGSFSTPFTLRHPLHLMIAPTQDLLYVTTDREHLRRIDLVNEEITTIATLDGDLSEKAVLPNGDILSSSFAHSYLVHFEDPNVAPTKRATQSLSSPSPASDTQNLRIKQHIVTNSRSKSKWKRLALNSVHPELAMASGTNFVLMNLSTLKVDWELRNTSRADSISTKSGIDLSNLRNAATPSQYGTISIQNSPNNQQITLHPLILKPFASQEICCSYLEQARFEESQQILDFCITSLYIPESFNSLPVTILSAKKLLHTHFMLHAFGQTHTNALWALATHILPKLASEDLVDLLFIVWTDGNLNTVAQDLLVFFLRPRWDLLAKEFDRWVCLATKHPESFFRLIGELHNDRTLKNISESISLRASPLTDWLLHQGNSMTWKSRSDEKLADLFRVSISDDDRVLDVNESLMYARWSYFRRMIDSGLGESHAGAMEFPAEFPPSLLLWIVNAIYGAPMSLSALPKSAEKDFVLQRGAEFGIVQMESAKPIAPFMELLDFIILFSGSKSSQ